MQIKKAKYLKRLATASKVSRLFSLILKLKYEDENAGSGALLRSSFL
jgi:hypothetical protein